MPTEKIYTLTTQEANILDLVAQYTSKIRELFADAHASVDAVIDHDEINAYPAFRVLFDLTELSEFSTGLFDTLSQGFAEKAGVVAEEGELYLLEKKSGKVTMQIIPAADPLAAVAALSGPEKLLHPNFPAFGALAKDSFLAEIDAAIAKSTDASQIAELQDAGDFIIKFQRDAVQGLSPITTAEMVSA